METVCDWAVKVIGMGASGAFGYYVIGPVIVRLIRHLSGQKKGGM